MKNLIKKNFQSILILALVVCIAIIALIFSLKPTKIEPLTLSLNQNAEAYIQSPKTDLTQNTTAELKKKYLHIFYSPWTDFVLDTNALAVAPSLLKQRFGFGPNLKRYDPDEMKKLYESMDVDHYPNAHIDAITIRDTNARVVPTDLPIFKSQNNYPFDRWQNSLIFSQTPVVITHYNTTKDFAFIQSNFVNGWVKVEDLAKITPKDKNFFLNIKNYIIPLKDKIPIYDNQRNFIRSIRIGEIIPVKEINQKTYEIYIAYKKPDGFMGLKTLQVKKEDFTSFPRVFNAINMADTINTMMGQFYGWGGMMQSRDCSAFLRDSFSNFGIFLPRNSAAQATHYQNLINLSKMPAKQKEEFIIKNATPFATLLWLRGHIMLYIGTYEGRAVVAHSAWSVLTKGVFSNTENLIGGVAITTLTPQDDHQNFFSKSTTLLDRIIGMSDISTLDLTQIN